MPQNLMCKLSRIHGVLTQEIDDRPNFDHIVVVQWTTHGFTLSRPRLRPNKNTALNISDKNHCSSSKLHQ
jgi:hypothetical protein